MNVKISLSSVLAGLYHASVNSQVNKKSYSDKRLSEPSKRAKLKSNRLMSEQLQSDGAHHGQVKNTHHLADEKTKHIKNNFREHQMRF